MEEIWKDVVGYEGLYQVSSFGRVKVISYNTKWGTIGLKEKYKKLTIKKKTDTYYTLTVSLTKNGKQKKHFVHRLLALAFIPNPENKPYIDHVNGIPWCNRINNLHWVTHTENMNNPITIKKRLHNISLLSNHWNNKKIAKCLSDKTILTIYDSAKDASKDGFNASQISQCLTGRHKTHKGFYWMYL